MSSLRPVSGTAEEIRALLLAWDAAPDPPPLVIETSGSTGRPKRVVLSRAAMRASALATIARLGGPGTWELNLPPSYVAGVQVIYRSIVSPGDRRYLSLVPTQLVRRVEDPALLAYDAVLVGGGPLDPRIRRQAEAFGIRVVQTYGMSETCGGCVYDGVPLDGVALKIDAEGQVLVGGPVLFDGYEDEPARTASVLQNGWLLTNDLGRLDEDGRLQVLGRIDDVIISGGVKVPPVAVARQLQSHPSLEAVEVVGVPDPEWGERVVAVVVGAVSLDELRDLVTPREWAPRELVFVSELPLLDNGKVDRAAVRELAR
ncbi:MAG TPA: AMP-dependent synthetase [Nocardioidaceae bacterium]|nr:AMP-dependent synthetase [Nocardioidaceae bacterium]